jgi:hypothetical protein
MLWISCFAICISAFPTAFSAGALNSEASRSSSGKCINSSMSPFFCGLTAARCCRVRITTRAIAILPDSTKASRRSTYALSPPFPGFEIIRLVEKKRIDLVESNEIDNVYSFGGLHINAGEISIFEDDELALLVFTGLRSDFRSSRNFNSSRLVAGYSETGMLTKPKLMAPFQRALTESYTISLQRTPPVLTMSDLFGNAPREVSEILRICYVRHRWRFSG